MRSTTRLSWLEVVVARGIKPHSAPSRNTCTPPRSNDVIMQSTQRKTDQTSHTTQKMLEKMGLVTILLRDKLFRLTGATLGKIKTLKSTERTFKWKFQGTFVVCENTEVSQLKRVRQIHVLYVCILCER